MDDAQAGFYGALASWWPLISPVEDYAEEAEYIAGLLAGAAGAARPAVLELGSGGGHLAHHLVDHFDLTLVDLSDEMLAGSRALNPGVPHTRGDMRTVRLGRSFDAVLIHDAIEYMTTEVDLAAALATAREHLRRGGRVVLVPDDTADTYEPGTGVSGADAPDGRGARLLEWTWDPDPRDTWVTTEYVFALRGADGAVTTARETHRHGLFPEETWLRLLGEAGFAARRVWETTAEERRPRAVFVGEASG
ncbi:trans-aconitate 2-methyltransferase [Demequina sp.]|uniref:class I SAM-dependent methyltransferase n=1 Tax=Demequina sp. TaxID=2050685 RepID=UPI0025F9F691|nr:class I SAM-dependent methyltransferase [Demequina sp.]